MKKKKLLEHYVKLDRMAEGHAKDIRALDHSMKTVIRDLTVTMESVAKVANHVAALEKEKANNPKRQEALQTVQNIQAILGHGRDKVVNPSLLFGEVQKLKAIESSILEHKCSPAEVPWRFEELAKLRRLLPPPPNDTGDYVTALQLVLAENESLKSQLDKLRKGTP